MNDQPQSQSNSPEFEASSITIPVRLDTSSFAAAIKGMEESAAKAGDVFAAKIADAARTMKDASGSKQEQPGVTGGSPRWAEDLLQSMGLVLDEIREIKTLLEDMDNPENP